MEENSNSKPLATESFSYSWLVNKNPNSPHKRSLSPQRNPSFDFDVLFTSSSLVHADEIFSDGRIMPFYVDRSSLKTAPQSPIGENIVGNEKRRGKWKRSIFRRWFGLLKFGCARRKSNRVDDLERKVCEVEGSPQPSYDGKGKRCDGLKRVKSCSPRVSPARSSNAWCVDESSIHEAILYCKRSIEK